LYRGKKYRLLVVDVDGVLTNVYSVWQYIHERLGTLNKAAKYREQFFRGEITYGDWAALEASLWKGVRISYLQSLLKGIKIRSGAKELVETARKGGLLTLAISAGLGILAREVGEKLGIDHVIANELVVRNDIITGEVVVNVDFYSKGTILRRFADSLGFSMDEVIVIGDGYTDIPMMNLSGFSIGYNPSSIEVCLRANIVLYHDTLYPIVHLLRSILLTDIIARGT